MTHKKRRHGMQQDELAMYEKTNPRPHGEESQPPRVANTYLTGSEQQSRGTMRDGNSPSMRVPLNTVPHDVIDISNCPAPSSAQSVYRSVQYRTLNGHRPNSGGFQMRGAGDGGVSMERGGAGNDERVLMDYVTMRRISGGNDMMIRGGVT